MYNEINYSSYMDRSSDLFDTDVSILGGMYDIFFDKNISGIDYIWLDIKYSSIFIYKALDEWYYVKVVSRLPSNDLFVSVEKFYKCDQLDGLLKLLEDV